MPFEVGGRADKFGNRYESRWVVKQLLRLVKEEISSITLEAIGEEEEGIDLWIKNNDGSLICSQCKARNGSKEFWDISDLRARDIFDNAKKYLDSNEKTTYQFVSAVNGMMLNDITIRARNSNDNPRDFYEYQIKSSSKVEKAYKKIVESFNLDYNSEKDRDRVFHYLKRIHIIHFPDDLETKTTLKETIKYLFTGNPETIYNLLLNFPIENDLLGKEITSYMLINYLKKQPEISLRQLHKDERIIPRIEYLNNEFSSSFVKINDTYIYRKEIEHCYKEILNGNSIVIHGKAGSGKSGCVIGLLEKLKKDNIVHLSLKLDRRVPEYSSESYGEQLGLPASPVFCIDAVSNGHEAVLILDQLDAIRWTNNHSSTALEVCKEMIAEVTNINKDRDKKISIVFVCRTFDFQNDTGIKQLFKSNETNERIEWKEILISELDDESVKRIVGVTYNDLTLKLRTLLKSPSNLYIWSNLEENSKKNPYKSSSDLIEQWWQQISINSEKLGISYSDLNELKDTIVRYIDNLGRLMIPIHLVSNCSKVAIEHLLSNGLLISEKKSIGFVHQSFFDYFLVEKMIQQKFNGDSITSILGPMSKQTPSKRYQLQMLLEYLQEYDMDYFVGIGLELIRSENVRFYMKYVFLEVLGQAEYISSKTEIFLKEYINSEYWRNHLFDAVFNNHPIYVQFLIREGYISQWLSSENDRESAMWLLRTVNSEIPDELTSLLYPLAFKDPELDSKIYSVLCWNIEEDSNNMFEFRLELLKFRPQLLGAYIPWERLAKNSPNRALKLFDEIVKNVKKEDIEKRHDLDEKAIKIFTEIAKDNPYQVWESFMPYIAESTQNTTSIYDRKLDFWKSMQYMEQLYGRVYVEMVKAAGKELVKIDTISLLERCEKYDEYCSLIINEILLCIMENLPSEYSDYAIKWLIEKPYRRFFNYTGESDDYLLSTKKIIEKHSKTCSDEVFKMLEIFLYYYHDEEELDRAKNRFKFNRENRKEQKKIMVYWSYWGEVQHKLLPALDKNRISKNTFELMRVLDRKFEGQEDIRYKRNKVRGGFVGSTIGSNAEKISDEQWIKIITKKDYKKEKWPLGEGPILESSPEQFSRDLERVGKQNPNRIASLAIKLSEDIDHNYIRAIFDIIGEKEASKDIVDNENWKPVDFDIAQKLYKKWSKKENISVVMSFCRGIRERANEPWNKDILNKISDIARNHPNPEEGKLNVVSSNDPDGKTVESLLTNSINCVRGCAAQAIASLLWEDSNRYEYLKDAVESIVNDENLAVNMSAIECIIPIMNFDREYAINSFFKLANRDLRIVAHPNAYYLFYYIYKDYTNEIKELVLKMYNSKLEDVSKFGANHLANMNVLYGCFNDVIFGNNKKSKFQKEGIIRIAVDLIGHQEHHKKCKLIIEHFLDKEKEDDFTFLLAQLLNKEKLNIHEDAGFILKLVTSKSNRRIIRHFVDFINENDVPIKTFKEIIFGMCQNIIENSKQEVIDIGSELYGIAPELSKLIALLYDRTQDDYEVNQQCLNIWDIMFESRIGTIRELTRTIMDL
jgi:hypothetical protein